MKKIDVEKTVRTLLAACDERSELHEIYKRRMIQIILKAIDDIAEELENTDGDINIEHFVTKWVEDHLKMQD